MKNKIRIDQILDHFKHPMAIDRQSLDRWLEMISQNAFWKNFLFFKNGYVLLEENKKETTPKLTEEPGVVVVPIVGMLFKQSDWIQEFFGYTSLSEIYLRLKEIENDPTINTILFYVNSPGGTVEGVPELADYIAKIKKRKVAVVDGMCCSAAYYLMASVPEIYATPTSRVGSIGVYSYLLDDSELYKEKKLKPIVIKSGEQKAQLLPGVKIDEKTIERIQNEVNWLGTKFVDFVKSHRNIDDKYLNGESWYAELAIEYKFVDAIVQFPDEVFIKNHGIIDENGYVSKETMLDRLKDLEETEISLKNRIKELEENEISLKKEIKDLYLSRDSMSEKVKNLEENKLSLLGKIDELMAENNQLKHELELVKSSKVLSEPVKPSPMEVDELRTSLSTSNGKIGYTIRKLI